MPAARLAPTPRSCGCRRRECRSPSSVTARISRPPSKERDHRRRRMRRAARTAAVVTPSLVVIAVAWLRLDEPAAPLWRVVALLALALAAAAPRRRSLRVLAAVAATVLAA